MAIDDELDLGTVYNNLMNHFYSNSQIEIAATIAAFMKIEKGTKTQAEFDYLAENFRQDMRQLGVISIDDLAALIAIKGMTDINRENFLKYYMMEQNRR